MIKFMIKTFNRTELLQPIKGLYKKLTVKKKKQLTVNIIGSG